MRIPAGVCVVALGCILAEQPARADYDSWDVFSGYLTVALHFGASGPSFSAGLRASWTNVMAPMPMGADLEARYVFDRGVFRILPGFNIMPAEPSLSDQCLRTRQAIDRRELIVQGQYGMLALGPVLELGEGVLDWGGWFGGNVAYSAFSSHLRGLYILERGLEAELGVGYKQHTDFGDDAPFIYCE